MIKRLVLVSMVMVIGLGFYLSKFKIVDGLGLGSSDRLGDIIVGSGENVDEVVNNDTLVKLSKPKKEKLSALVTDIRGEEVEADLIQNDSGTEASFNIGVANKMKPGKYHIKIVDSSGRVKEKDFWWGVLAINTKQSIYRTNDEANFAIAVLDDFGNMVCDAKLKLTLTSPSGEVIKKSTEAGDIKVNKECFVKGVTSNPDYEMDYKLNGEEGEYKIALEAVTEKGSYKISDKFKVESEPDFEISRDLNTRLYPFEINKSKIIIKANHDFEGKVTETLPNGFVVVSTDKGKTMVLPQSGDENDPDAAELNQKTQIEWDVKIRQGETRELSYAYDAPNISPEFFKLSKLSLVSENEVIFNEFRRWQIAVDAEVVIGTNLKDATAEYNPSPSVVFTDANNGYMFYIYKLNVGNTWGQPVYRKTTDGGANWGTPVGIGDSAPSASFSNIAVWYDQWTPGDTSGTKIHIAAVEVTTDDAWYNFVDTGSSDAQRGGGWSTVMLGTLYDPNADGNVSIAKNTNNDIFVSAIGTFGATAQRVYRSNDGGNNFTDTSLTLTSGLDDGDFAQLLPLSNGDVLYIVQDITVNKLLSKELDVGTSAWKNEVDINTDYVENTTYDVSWSAALNKNTGDVYLVANDKIAQTTGSLRFYKFDGSGRTWTERQRLVNNSPYLLQGSVSIDPATNDLYVAYITGQVNSLTDIFFKRSVNDGISWSPQNEKLNTTTDDFKYIRTNGWNSNINYIVWYNDDTEDVTGIEVPKTLVRSPVPDSSVIDLAITDSTDEYSNSPNIVFTDVDTGYAFYVDAPSSVKYSKTTDGGNTWGSPISIGNTGLAWANVSIWYDQWTPGDTTGTKIHIAAQDDTTGTEDVWYNYIDTGNSDAENPGGWISVINTTAWTVDSYPGPSITKASDGTLYIMGAGTVGTAKTVVMSSGNTGSSWSDTSYNTNLAAGDFGQLLPYSVGATTGVIYIKQDISTNQLESYIYNGGWQSVVDVDTGSTMAENGTYDAQWGATIDRTTGNIYLAGASSIGVAGNDLKVYKMIAATGVWETRPDIITDNNQLLQASIAIDENNQDLYVTYIRGGTINATTDVFFVQSLDDGSSWSGETQLNTLQDDLKYVRTNLMSSSSIVALWYNDDLNDMVMNSMGITKMRQTGYKWFENADSLSAGATMAADNVGITLPSGNTQFRLRLLIQAGVAVEALANKEYKLQYSEMSGTCDTSFSGETYTDVLTGSGPVRFYDNVSLSNGDTVTSSRYDPIDGGNTVIRQSYVESNNFSNNIDPIYGEKDGMWDLALQTVSAPDDTSYCLRAVKSDESVISGGYAYIPQFTTAGSATGSNTAYSFQRKTWYDGARYWRSYNDLANSRINFEYSSDGTTWTENTSARISVDTSDYSIEADSSNLFIVYTSAYDIKGRKASSYPSTSFSWGTEQTVLTGTGATDLYSYPVISRDSGSYVWVGSRYKGNGVYYPRTIKETGVSNDLPEDSGDIVYRIADVTNSDSNVYSTLASNGSQKMYITFLIGSSINGCYWDNSSSLWKNTTNSTCSSSFSLGSGLKAYWKMDESSWNGTSNEVVDSSGNSAHGVRSGNANTINDGFKRAGSFDGTDDFITVANTTTIDQLSALTFSYWIGPLSTGNLDIIDKTGGSSTGWALNFNSGKFQFNANYTGTDLVCVGPIAGITDSDWQQVIFTWDGSGTCSGVNLYKNGVLQTWSSTQSSSGSREVDTGNDLLIGTNTFGGDYYGRMDEVRIYDRVLSTTEIADLSVYTPDPTDGLAGYWNLDEGSGSTAIDLSANGNDGVITSPHYVTGLFNYGLGTSINNTQEFVTVTDPAGGELDFSNTQSFTISSWVKFTSLESNLVIAMKNYNGNPALAGYVAYINNGGGSYPLICAYSDGVGGTADDSGSLYTSGLDDGNWHNVVCVYDRTGDIFGTPAIYALIDGVIVSLNSSLVEGTGVNSGDIIVGEPSTSDEMAGGILDDVRIYNRALGIPEARVLNDYNPNGVSGSLSYDNVGTGLTGITNSISSVGDSSGNVHLTYVGVGGSMVYREYSTSWQSPVVLDSASGNGYPTISYNTSNNNLYSFWTRGSDIYYKTGSDITSSSSLSFDGVDDYVNVPYNANFDFTTDLTVEFWFNPTTTIGSGITGNMGIISKANTNSDANNDWTFFWNSGESGRLRFGAYGDYVQTTNSTWTAGTWYHVSATVTSSTTANVYVNGVLDTYGGDTSIAASPINGNQDTNFLIGVSKVSTGDHYFNGKIDEVRIYNTARSESQIKSDMFTKLDGSETNLGGYWSFNDGTGQVVTDLDSNANNGTLGATSGTSSDDPTWSSTIPFNYSWESAATAWQTTGTNTYTTSNYNGNNQIFAQWLDGSTIMWDRLIYTNPPTSPAVNNLLRHGGWFLNGVRQKFTF